MYQGGMLAKQEADQRTEEAMMSGKPVQLEETTELNRVREHYKLFLNLQGPGPQWFKVVYSTCLYILTQAPSGLK